MKVTLLAHTQLAESIYDYFDKYGHSYEGNTLDELEVVDGQVISLAAIRQCYSHKTALEVLKTESEKYFSEKAKEAKRLFNHIVKSGHTSTLEHLNFTFAIEGVSRSLLAQLTRHRHMSFSVQSQRYTKFSSDSRSGGFDYVIPEKVENHENEDVKMKFKQAMGYSQAFYNTLIDMGIPQEDARAVLPNAATCNLVLTANLRTLLEFYEKRKPGNGAQHEIAQLAEELKNRIVEVEPWTEEFFE